MTPPNNRARRITDIVETAARQNRQLQYLDLKRIGPNNLYIFQVGDFCECYADDAKFVAQLTGLPLFHPEGFALVGFPEQALSTYLTRIINAGKRVCLCCPKQPNPQPVL